MALAAVIETPDDKIQNLKKQNLKILYFLRFLIKSSKKKTERHGLLKRLK